MGEKSAVSTAVTDSTVTMSRYSAAIERRNDQLSEGERRLRVTIDSSLDAVVLSDVNNDQLVKRVSGRRTCEFCKKVFNVNFAPCA